VAVEAALVTPLVLALVFGIIEAAFLCKDILAGSSAVRAGVRLASAQPRTTTYAQAAADEVAQRVGALGRGTIESLWIYKAGAGSDKPVGRADFADCSTCVKFSWSDSTRTFVPVSPLTGWSAAAQNACARSLGGPPDRIGVLLRIRHDAMTGMVFRPITLTETSVLSLEPISSQAGCKP
jgi:hypothetical protein